MTGKAERRTRRLLVMAAAVGLLGASGCHHRKPQPVLLPPQTNVPLVDVPTEANLPLVEEPKAKLPPVPVADAASKPKRARRRSTRQAGAGGTVQTTSPAAVTGAAAPTKQPEGGATTTVAKNSDAAVLGALTVGGEQSPRALQEASELIASNDRRLASTSGETAKTQAALLSKVRNFQKDAQVALRSGDAEGAKTLATKGKLLLDDMDTAKQ